MSTPKQAAAKSRAAWADWAAREALKVEAQTRVAWAALEEAAAKAVEAEMRAVRARETWVEVTKVLGEAQAKAVAWAAEAKTAEAEAARERA